MRTPLLVSAFLLLFSTITIAQSESEYRIPMIGESAPTFVAESTMDTIKFPGDYYNKWKILFSHPADFTPVCSTEILELASKKEEFNKLNTKLVVISTDGLNSHIEWVKSLEGINYKGNEKVMIDFPIVSDHSLLISKSYGMIHPKSSTTRNVRGVFIIDPDDKIRAIFFYPSTTGRNIEEIKRTLIALQLTEKKNVLTPADWTPGQDVLIPSPQNIKEANKLEEKNDPKLYSLAWYLWFTKL